MNDMTNDKVKALLNSFSAICGENAKAKELCANAIEFIEQQQKTLDAAEKVCEYAKKVSALTDKCKAKDFGSWEMLDYKIKKWETIKSGKEWKGCF